MSCTMAFNPNCAAWFPSRLRDAVHTVYFSGSASAATKLVSILQTVSVAGHVFITCLAATSAENEVSAKPTSVHWSRDSHHQRTIHLREATKQEKILSRIFLMKVFRLSAAHLAYRHDGAQAGWKIIVPVCCLGRSLQKCQAYLTEHDLRSQPEGVRWMKANSTRKVYIQVVS